MESCFFDQLVKEALPRHQRRRRVTFSHFAFREHYDAVRMDDAADAVCYSDNGPVFKEVTKQGLVQ